MSKTTLLLILIIIVMFLFSCSSQNDEYKKDILDKNIKDDLIEITNNVSKIGNDLNNIFDNHKKINIDKISDANKMIDSTLILIEEIKSKLKEISLDKESSIESNNKLQIILKQYEEILSNSLEILENMIEYEGYVVKYNNEMEFLTNSINNISNYEVNYNSLSEEYTKNFLIMLDVNTTVFSKLNDLDTENTSIIDKQNLEDFSLDIEEIITQLESLKMITDDDRIFNQSFVELFQSVNKIIKLTIDNAELINRINKNALDINKNYSEKFDLLKQSIQDWEDELE